VPLNEQVILPPSKTPSETATAFTPRQLHIPYLLSNFSGGRLLCKWIHTWTTALRPILRAEEILDRED